MEWESLRDQESQLPQEGLPLVAHFDDDSIVVYQAYKAGIASWAMEHQRLGGPQFSMTRMTWIKPSFLWMMYRSGWATKPDQEHILAIRVPRSFFDSAIHEAVSAKFDPDRFSDRDEWTAAVRSSDVRVQWDPDRGPTGEPLARRAIQLGLRNDALDQFLASTRSVEDITTQVHAQAACLPDAPGEIRVPVQRIYEPKANLGAGSSDS